MVSNPYSIRACVVVVTLMPTVRQVTGTSSELVLLKVKMFATVRQIICPESRLVCCRCSDVNCKANNRNCIRASVFVFTMVPTERQVTCTESNQVLFYFQ